MAANHFKVGRGLSLVGQTSAPSSPTNGDIYYDSTLNKFQKYENGAWSDFGSSSGSGGGLGVNFIGLDTSFLATNTSDPGAETTVGNWAAYADAAGATPVDMTGGSPVVTIARTTTSGEVLDGAGSFKVVKDAANRQGNGVSVLVNVPVGYRGQKASFAGIFKIISGSIAAGDVVMSVYDVTNTTLLTMTNPNLATASGFFLSHFTLGATTAQLRVGFHFATTSATAVTFSFDDVFMLPKRAVFDVASPLTTTGDILTHTGGINDRVAVGVYGQVLMPVSGIPAWSRLPGQPNYLSQNPDAEVDTSGWATYADAAGTSPVDGTGGSPTFTWTRSTSAPLRQTANFLATKDAANRQGNGASYDFTIDAADKGRLITGEVDYAIASGTYADGDLVFFVYDVTNAVLIPVFNSTIQTGATDANLRQVIQFQASSTSTSYRLIIHVASTSAVAYTVKFDNFRVGPQIIQVGAPVTDEVDDSNNFTINGFGTVTNKAIYTRRVGNVLQVRGVFTTGTAAATTASIQHNLYAIDSTKFGSGTNTQIVGFGEQLQTGGAAFASSLTFAVFYDGSDTSKVYLGNDIATRQFTKDTGNGIANSSDVVTFKFDIPIAGWASNVNMSASTRTTPTQQRFISGSGTYTTPAGVKYLKVRMVGAGGGGSGSGSASGAGGAGTAGGASTFGTSLLTANGGGAAAGGAGISGGSGGSASVASPAFGTALSGGDGGGDSEWSAAGANSGYHAQGHGGISFFGGAGPIPAANAAGIAAAANTGSGGSGGNKQAVGGVVTDAGGGGGAGGYVEAFVPSPSATYSYAVGTGGSGGAAGSSGKTGGAGANGYLEITEFYANEGSIAASPAMGYFSGYFTDSSQWTTTSGSFVDGTNSGGNALTTVESSNLGTIAAGASNVCGVTITPPSTTAAYEVTFMGDMDNTGTSGDGILRIFDGTTMVGAQRFRSAGASGGRFPVTISGIWRPRTTALSTIKLQFAATVGTFETIANSTAGVCVWVTIKQIAV